MSDTKNLKSLGAKTANYSEPNIKILETFSNQHPKTKYLVPFRCHEFTSLCPKTGQPDFASFEIVYVPRKEMVESKSLKLYLGSFRNHGEFHEDVTNRIFKDLWKTMNPFALRVIGDFAVRGGISIKPIVYKLSNDLTDKQKIEIEKLFSTWDILKSKLDE